MVDSVEKNMDKLHVKPEFESPDQEDDQTETSIQQQSYVIVLKEEDIWRLIENMIQSVIDVSSLSKAEATLVLSHFHWDVSRFESEWFDNATSVRERVGILEKSLDQSSDDKEFLCGACIKSHQLENSASVSCGHRVCTNCWTSHIKNSFNESQEWNVWLKCPYSCQASVGRDTIERFASEENKTKYDRYLLKSFVGDSKTMKLCPRVASGRSCAIDISPDDSENSDVYCVCLLKFCWNCSKDVHSPVDCETAAKWLAMIISGYQNPNRLCRGDWTKHGEGTCYNDAVPHEESQDFSADNQQWRMEDFSADRFRDCYKNWDSNDSLTQKGESKLQRLRSVDIPELSKIQLPTEEQLEFIIEAALQIIESTRILKWTYAYQYYLQEDKHGLLKIWQDHVKLLMKELDDCIEYDLRRFLEAEGLSENFNDFRIKLTELTSKTRKYNEELIIHLEDGFANDVSA